METPPHSPSLIPTTIPQAAAPPRTRVERAEAPARVRVAPTRIGNVTISMTPRVAVETPARRDARNLLNRQALQALGSLPYPATLPRDRRETLSLALADEVMTRVVGTEPLPSELRLIDVRSIAGVGMSGPFEGITYTVVAWPASQPPPLRPVAATPDGVWDPNNPLSLAGTELDLERALIRFSGRS